MVAQMKILKDFKIQNECLKCVWRSSGFFCNLPVETLKTFSLRKITHAYPKGTTLFVEGQPANGVYVLCAGRVKLTTYSAEGRAIIVRIAEPGEVLGLSACVAGISWEASAQAVDDCQVNFVRRAEFLDLLKTSSHVALNAIRDLSLSYHRAHTQICSLGLSASVSDKLAKLFLDWYEKSDNDKADRHILMSYTHEEIAEMIGTSRETVTRVLKTFKARKLISLNGTDLHIPDKKKLAATIGSRSRSSGL